MPSDYQEFIDFLVHQEFIRNEVIDELSQKVEEFEKKKASKATATTDEVVAEQTEVEMESNAEEMEQILSPLLKPKITENAFLTNNQRATAEEHEDKTQNSEIEFGSSTPNTNIKKRYEILETLGEGGMGMVQRVKDQVLGREVALKTIKSANASNIHGKQRMMLWRLQREASITAKLEHPNIIPLHDVHQEKGLLQFTMRKVDGNTLKEILEKMKNGEIDYDESRLLYIFLKICDAVSYAHSRGIVHRDLKPENIMVGQFGEVYVMDWGIAKPIKQNPISDEINIPKIRANKKKKIASTLPQFDFHKYLQNDFVDTDELEQAFYKTVGGIGTPGYMSPEQKKEAGEVTPQSDIYALGKILRECFVLYSPLEEFKLVLNHLQNDNSFSQEKKLFEQIESKISRKLPSDVQAIVEKATEEIPSKRYDTVQNLAFDVTFYLKNYRVSVKDYGFIELFYKWTNRNKKSISIALFSILFVLVSLYGVFWFKAKVQLKENQERLEQLLALMIEPKRGDRELALLEIGKMQEPEILQQLIHELTKGTNYFLQTKTQKTNLNLYYQFIPEAIGHLGNSNSQKPLLDSLYLLYKKIIKIPEKNHSLAEIQFMVSLVNALKDSKAKGISHWLDGLRHQLGIHSNFSKQTEEAYYRLGFIDNLTKKDAHSSENYFRRAHLSFHLERFDQAIADYTKVIELSPKNASAFNNRGLAKSEAKDIQGAIEDFDQAIRLFPDYQNAYNNRGASKLEAGDFAGAIKDFDEAIRLMPKKASSYSNRGSTKEKLQDLDGAIADYDKAIQLAPQVGIFYINRGEIQIKKKNLAKALADFNRALALNDKDPKGYFNRGRIRSLRGNLEGALLDLNEAIRLNPHLERVYTYRGKVKRKIGDLPGALADFKKALEFNPDNAGIYMDLARLKEREEHFEEAIKLLSKAIELDKKKALAYKNRGSIKRKLKDFTGALKDFDQAILLDPGDWKLFKNKGMIYFWLKKYQAAVLAFDKAIKLYSQDSESFKYRAKTQMHLRKNNEALKDFTSAIQLAPELAINYYERGVLRQRMNNLKGAFEDFNKNIQLDPKNYRAFANRGILKLSQRDLDGAFDDFTNSIRLEPNNAICYNNRADIWLRRKEYDKAREDANKAIECDANFSTAYFCLGFVYKAKKEFPKAIEAFEKGLSIRKVPSIMKQHADLTIHYCVQLYRNKKLIEAKEVLIQFKKKAHKKHPMLPKVEQMLQQIEKKLKQ